MSDSKYTTQLLESLLVESRTSPEHRERIINAHFDSLVSISLHEYMKHRIQSQEQTNDKEAQDTDNDCTKVRLLNRKGDKENNSLQPSMLATQILVNLCFENESIAHRINNDKEFMNYLQGVVTTFADQNRFPEGIESVDETTTFENYIRNVVVLLKNIACLITEEITFHSSLSFIQGLANIYLSIKQSRAFVLELLDIILEQFGIPDSWKSNPEWIHNFAIPESKNFASSNNFLDCTSPDTHENTSSSSKGAPRYELHAEILRLFCVCNMEEFFTNEIRELFGVSILLQFCQFTQYEVDWEDEEDIDLITLYIHTLKYLLMNVQSNVSTFEDELMKNYFTEVLKSIIIILQSLPKEHSQNEEYYEDHYQVIIKTLEFIADIMQKTNHMNNELLRKYNLIGIMNQLRTQPSHNEVDTVKYERQIARIICFLALDDEVSPTLVQEEDSTLLLLDFIRENKDILLKRNACIAIGNLARSDRNCKKLIQEYHVHHILIQELERQLDLIVEIFDGGDASAQPDIQFVSNLCFTIANLSIYKDEHCIQQLIEANIVHVISKGLHPKFATTIHIYVVDILYNVLSFTNHKNIPHYDRIVWSLKELLSSSREKLKLYFLIIKTMVLLNSLATSTAILNQQGISSSQLFEEISNIRIKDREGKLKEKLDTLEEQIKKSDVVSS